MKYNNKVQAARQRYLKRLPLSDQEQELIDKDLSGKDFAFFLSEDKPFILPHKYDEDATYALIENQRGKAKLKIQKQFVKYFGYAAAVLFIVLCSTAVYNYVIQSPTIMQISTAEGEKKEIKLPDGSTVILNCLSSLSYPQTMDGSTREVVLNGEAYFDVAKNPKSTFIVKAENIEVKVLGTKFNINAYEDKENITTTLFEGIVSVGIHARNPSKLKPGEQAIFSKKTKELETRVLSHPAEEEAWRNDVLVFDNEKLANILETLSRQYGVKFEIDNKQLEQLRITARFDTSVSIQNALNILSQSANFTYIKENNKYKIVAS